MGFISTLFGGSTDPLLSLRKLAQRQCWAEVQARAAAVDKSQLSPEQLDELEQLTIQSGDGLAKLNLLEGDALADNDELMTARDHYRLALSYVRNHALFDTIQERLRSLDAASPPAPGSLADIGCGSGHCDASRGNHPGEQVMSELGEDARLELIAAASTPEMAARYRQLQGVLLEAVLLAHEDRFDEAMSVFSEVPHESQDELFFFERGSLLARHGRNVEACSDLQLCTTRFQFLPAMEGLIDLSFSNYDLDGAEALLASAAAKNLPGAYTHARMAFLNQARGHSAQALSHAQTALQSGCRDPEIVLLAANIYESENDLDAAESLLTTLGSGGCAGSGNPYLADFRFRHKRNLPAALEGFKTAARHDPGNSYWFLRIAQTYLLLGWVKEAKPLLSQVASASSVTEQVRAIALDELSRL